MIKMRQINVLFILNLDRLQFAWGDDRPRSTRAGPTGTRSLLLVSRNHGNLLNGQLFSVQQFRGIFIPSKTNRIRAWTKIIDKVGHCLICLVLFIIFIDFFLQLIQIWGSINKNEENRLLIASLILDHSCGTASCNQ